MRPLPGDVGAMRGVDWRRDSDAEHAVAALLTNVIHSGLPASPIGWCLRKDGEWTRLEIIGVHSKALAA